MLDQATKLPAMQTRTVVNSVHPIQYGACRVEKTPEQQAPTSTSWETGPAQQHLCGPHGLYFTRFDRLCQRLATEPILDGSLRKRIMSWKVYSHCESPTVSNTTILLNSTALQTEDQMTRAGLEPATKGLRGPCSPIELAGQTSLLYREEALCQDNFKGLSQRVESMGGKSVDWRTRRS